MAGFLLAPCRNVHPVEMYRQGKQDADMRVRKNTVGYVWRGKWIIRVCLHLCWRWQELPTHTIKSMLCTPFASLITPREKRALSEISTPPPKTKRLY